MSVAKQRFLKLFLLLSFISCSQVKEKLLLTDEPSFGDKGFADSFIGGINANWFKQPKKFILTSDDGTTPKHMFLDVSPDINMNVKSLNFVIKTPEDSENAYEIDLLSGQHYMEHKYCGFEDAWDRFSGNIYRPPYSIGIVPRVLDQLGTPQKIIVFGDKEYYQENYKSNFFTARIVGGFIEQYCPKGACLNHKQWSSRLVLIGVQKNNEDFENIKSLAELKKEVDWPYVRAFVENGFGNNLLGNKYYPAFKMGATIDAFTALSFLKKNSIFLTTKKLTTMKNSCYGLYDKLWSQYGNDSKFEKKLRSVKSLLERARVEKVARKDRNAFFYRRFIRSFKKYERNLKTCMKYVYYGNIHENPERFWLFTYLNFFTLAHEEGYTYSCSRGTWIRNPLVRSTRRAIPLQKEFANCSDKDIDKAFDQAVSLMEILRNNGQKSHRFIGYDGGAYGTHHKMYSVVNISPRRYKCSKKKEHFLIQRVFPKDKRWKKKAIFKKSSGLIYN